MAVQGAVVADAIWHSVKRFVSVLCVALVIGAIVWAAYITFIKPHYNPLKTQTQTADEIINYNVDPKPMFFGCANFKIMRPDKEVIKNANTNNNNK